MPLAPLKPQHHPGGGGGALNGAPGPHRRPPPPAPVSPATRLPLRPQVTNIVWAYATLDLRVQALTEGLTAHVVDGGLVAALQPRGVATVAWALAKLGVRSPAFGAALAERLLRPGSLEAFTSHDVAQTAWAFASFGDPVPGVMQAIARRALQRGLVEECNGQVLLVGVGEGDRVASLTMNIARLGTGGGPCRSLRRGLKAEARPSPSDIFSH